MTDQPKEKATTLLRQNEVNYSTLSSSPGQACANCRWFSGVDGSWCRIVESTPLDIMNTGYCSRWEQDPTTVREGSVLNEITEVVEMMGSAEHTEYEHEEPALIVDEQITLNPEPDDKPEKSIVGKAVDRVKAMFTRDEFTDGMGVKIHGNHWLIVWSNNFEDREGEIFTAKAIDDYVGRVDAGLVPTPALVVWHIDGVSAKESVTRIGDADFVARHGHFLLAAGTFDDTKQAQSAKAYYKKHARKTKVSHGFTYDPRHFDGRHYKQFNTFEISLLPEGVEANRYTSLSGVKDMDLTDQKRQYINDVFGDAVASELLEKLTVAGDAIKELDVAYKDFVEVNESDVDVEAKKEAVDRVETQLKDLIPDLVDGQALTAKSTRAAITGIEELRNDVKSLTDRIAQIEENTAATPKRATESKSTIVTEGDAPNLKKNITEQMTARDPFFGVEVKGDV